LWGLGALHARSVSPPLESASSRKEIWTPSTKFPKLRLDRFIRFCTAHRPRYMRHVCERAASTHCMRALRSNNAGGSSAECVRDGKRIATVWCLSVCLSRFYPRDAILARVLAMAMCPCLSVCLSVTSQCSIKKDGQMNMLFGMKASFGHVLHCVLRKLRHLQK